MRLVNLLQYSPKHRALLYTIYSMPDTVDSTQRNFQSILDNYNTILELWKDILNNNPDSETRAFVNWVASKMQSFNYFFGACLLHSVLWHTDNLSKTMQHTRMSACEAQSKDDSV